MFDKPIPSLWWRMKMMKAYVAGDYTRAIEFATKILNRKTSDVSALWAIADCYRLQHKYDQAIDYAERAFVSDPQHIDILQLLSTLYFECGDNHSAYDYVCRGLAVIKMVDSSLDEIINAVMHSLTSPKVATRPVCAIYRAISDERAKTKEWIKWAAQFKTWYEASEQL